MASIDDSDAVAQRIWKHIPFALQYEISEFGEVRRIGKANGAVVGKILSNTFHHFGYPRVCLCTNGKARQYEVHKLVANTFLGKKPFLRAEVAHLDGNPRNNHFSNLCWKSHKDNEADKFLHGTSSEGERNGGAKLTIPQVIRIRHLVKTQSLKTIAMQFGISFQTVSKIKNNKSWRFLNV